MPDARSRSRLPLLASSLVALALVGAGCDRSASGPAPGAAPAAPPPLPVTVVEMQPRSVPIVLEAVARTEGSREVEVRARVAGILERQLFREGEPIRAGAPMYRIDRAPFEIALAQARAVTVLLALMGVSLLAWPLAATPWALAVVLVPWGLGCFASNSAQQARLGLAAPRLAPALLALNTSAIYVGQAIGAAGGGMIVAAGGGAPEAYRPLSWVGLGWLAVAVALSVWATRRMQRAGHG